MLLSKKIIKSFIDGIEEISEESIVNTLNAIGAEVENIYHFPKTDSYVTIGQINEVREHPHSEKLSICRVRINTSQLVDIVCGAKNVKNRESVIGKYVIVALTGSELPNGKTIMSKNINGIMSEGMLCSYEELNPEYRKYISANDLDDIIILNDAKLFDKDISKYISTDDVIYDISIPTNRPEWQGVRFICYEIAASLNLRFKDKMRNFFVKNRRFNKAFKVLNYAPSLCNYYDVIHLRSKRVKNSTWDLKGVLINHMIKPINDIIDNCTLISLITGNPIHIYDANKIEGQLILRISSKRETIIGSDDKKYEIFPGDLIVCDRVKIVALAGIVISKEVMVNNETTSFLIEIANYKKTKIIETLERLNTSTFSGKMFSKQVSLYATKLTIQHIYRYLLKNNLPQQLSELNSKCNVDSFCRKIPINFNDIRNLIGLSQNELSNAQIEYSLKSIGFDINGSMVLVPSYRSDIWTWQDIAEEVVKMININLLKQEPIVANYSLEFEENNNYEMLKKLHEKLCNLQISNVHTYNLTNYEDAKIFDFFNHKEPIKVLDANSVEREYFRVNIISNLLKVLDLNKKRKNKLIPIFELQNLLTQKGSEHHIGIALPSKLFENNYINSGIENNLLTMKGLSNIIVDNFGFRCAYKKIDQSDYLITNDSLQLVVYNQIIGYIGQVRPSILKKYDLADTPIYVLDINLEKLITSLNRIQKEYVTYSKLQNIDRDITFTLEPNNAFDDFIEVIDSIPEIIKWELISIYEKETNEKNNSIVQINELENDLVTIDTTTGITSKFVQSNHIKNSKIINYTVRYFIEQNLKTLSTQEINEITKNLIKLCEIKGIKIQK
ncbi:phenylalanine--tRNA ligase subunit beta [Mycoplasmoides pirum]|uniref:phenylalanine--tRNA ligase subunit beta n=1 Tax=Mycoplasmoides pirum TaxID=2122 RepID=UPI000480548B|nr:phenylalanine--tRNA ligase subunit beta [Mycoplasmoides pirum]